MGGYDDGEIPVIVRGEGCHLEDANGKRYLDALAGLFAVQIGYSHGEEIGQAALEQMRELPFYTNWSYAHPRAIELAHELAAARAGRPEPRLLRLGRLGGGRVGVEARAPVPRRARRAPLEGRSRGGSPTTGRRWARSRSTGSRRCARRSSRSSRASSTSATRTATTVRPARPRREFTAFLLDDLEQAIEQAGPEHGRDGDHGAGAERRRLASRRPPATSQGVRELCDRYGILLCADEVITASAALGEWFGSRALRHPARPRSPARRDSRRRTRRSAP